MARSSRRQARTSSRTVLVERSAAAARDCSLSISPIPAASRTAKCGDYDGSFDPDGSGVASGHREANDGNTAGWCRMLNSTTERAVLFVLNLETARRSRDRHRVGSHRQQWSVLPRGWDEDATVRSIRLRRRLPRHLWKCTPHQRSLWNVANGRRFTLPGCAAVTAASPSPRPSTDKRWCSSVTASADHHRPDRTSLQAWHGVIDDPAATASVTARHDCGNIAYFDNRDQRRAFEPNSALRQAARGGTSTSISRRRIRWKESAWSRSAVIKNVLLASTHSQYENPCRGGRGYVNAWIFHRHQLASGFLRQLRGNGVFVPTTVGPGTPLGSVNHNGGLITEIVIVGNNTSSTVTMILRKATL